VAQCGWPKSGSSADDSDTYSDKCGISVLSIMMAVVMAYWLSGYSKPIDTYVYLFYSIQSDHSIPVLATFGTITTYCNGEAGDIDDGWYDYRWWRLLHFGDWNSVLKSCSIVADCNDYSYKLIFIILITTILCGILTDIHCLFWWRAVLIPSGWTLKLCIQCLLHYWWSNDLYYCVISEAYYITICNVNQ